MHGCHGLKSRQFLVTIPSTKSRLFQEGLAPRKFQHGGCGIPFPQNNSETLCENLEPNIYTWDSEFRFCAVTMSAWDRFSTRSSVSRIPTHHECPMMPHAVTSAPYPHGGIALGSFFAAAKTHLVVLRDGDIVPIWWIVAFTAFLYI